MAPAEKVWESRAVLRIIEPGTWVRCPRCGDRVVFKAAQKEKPRQVIVNVYEAGAWKRTEHFHEGCYTAAAEPYGTPDASPPPSRANNIGRRKKKAS